MEGGGWIKGWGGTVGGDPQRGDFRDADGSYNGFGYRPTAGDTNATDWTYRLLDREDQTAKKGDKARAKFVDGDGLQPTACFEYDPQFDDEEVEEALRVSRARVRFWGAVSALMLIGWLLIIAITGVGAATQDVDRSHRSDRLTVRTIRAPDGVNTCQVIGGEIAYCTLVSVTNRTILGKPCTIRYGCRTLRPPPAILLTPTQRCEGTEDQCACKLGIIDPDHADEELSDRNLCKNDDLE